MTPFEFDRRHSVSVAALWSACWNSLVLDGTYKRCCMPQRSEGVVLAVVCKHGDDPNEPGECPQPQLCRTKRSSSIRMEQRLLSHRDDAAAAARV